MWVCDGDGFYGCGDGSDETIMVCGQNCSSMLGGGFACTDGRAASRHASSAMGSSTVTRASTKQRKCVKKWPNEEEDFVWGWELL